VRCQKSSKKTINHQRQQRNRYLSTDQPPPKQPHEADHYSAGAGSTGQLRAVEAARRVGGGLIVAALNVGGLRAGQQVPSALLVWLSPPHAYGRARRGTQKAVPPSAAVWSMPLCRVLWFGLNKLLSQKKAGKAQHGAPARLSRAAAGARGSLCSLAVVASSFVLLLAAQQPARIFTPTSNTVPVLVNTPHSQPRALRHTTVLSNIMSL
jgi:hypothetical protein